MARGGGGRPLCFAKLFKESSNLPKYTPKKAPPFFRSWILPWSVGCLEMGARRDFLNEAVFGSYVIKNCLLF